MKHSLIICTRNRSNSLARTVQIAQAAASEPLNILIVDASDPLEATKVRDLSEQIGARFIHTSPSLPAQRNVGLLAIDDDAEYIHFLDDDVDILGDYFHMIEEIFLSDQEIGGVGVRTLDNPEGPPVFRINRPKLAQTYSAGHVTSWGENLPFWQRGTYEVKWLPGCAMSYRRTAILGMFFSEHRKGYAFGEDVDFSMRVGKRGKLVITDSVVVNHRLESSGRPSRLKLFRQFLRHYLLLLKDHPEELEIWNVLRFLWAKFSPWPRLKSLLNPSRFTYQAVGVVKRSIPPRIRALVKKNWPEHKKPGFLKKSLSIAGEEDSSLSEVEVRLDEVAISASGGLGNQLFQLAAGLELAEKSGLSLLVDKSSFGNGNPRPYLLEEFQCLGFTEGTFRAQRVFKETSFCFNEDLWGVEGGTLVEGYFQSWKYFGLHARKIAQALRTAPVSGPQIFMPGRSFEIGEIEGKFIACQVRRGDYLSWSNLQYHGIVQNEYFLESVIEIRQLLGNLPVIYFSDDVGTAFDLMTETPNSGVHVPPGGSDTALQTLAVMSRAAGLIISNSSFGWWAGFASESPVIAPNPWILGTEYCEADLLLPGWISRSKEKVA